jgi:hypothetical protein
VGLEFPETENEPVTKLLIGTLKLFSRSARAKTAEFALALIVCGKRLAKTRGRNTFKEKEWQSNNSEIADCKPQIRLSS